jgi:hypothetical protein
MSQGAIKIYRRHLQRQVAGHASAQTVGIMERKRVNPLSRRPRKRRLVMAVRGAAGTGKSVFASTLADAGLGRLCFFDTERKARLLPGSDGTKFDAIEVEHPDELIEFIDWALGDEGRQQGYGCYVLDSWAMYFGRKHRQTIQAVRGRTGDPLAQPSADDLANDQVLFQEVLRRLCIDSDACVVITDQIAAKGKEDREANELGKVLPMTTGGLEYYVDVMVELSVRVEDFRQVRVAQVIKSNSAAFPIGLEIKDPTFHDFLDRLGEGPQPPPLSTDEETLPPVPLAEPDAERPSLDDLIEQAEGFGLERSDVLIAARHYCGVNDLEQLSPAQIMNLLSRMTARYGVEAPSAADVNAASRKNGRQKASANGSA